MRIQLIALVATSAALGACASAPTPVATSAPAPVTAAMATVPVAATRPTPGPDAATLAARERDRRAAEVEADRQALATVLYFEYDKDELRPEVTSALEHVADVLRRRPALTIRLNGNADDRGSDEYNLALGQRRAAAAKRWLVDHGIATDRVAIVSFGRERPVCKDDVESCWQKNRRDEVVVTRGDDALTATGN